MRHFLLVFALYAFFLPAFSSGGPGETNLVKIIHAEGKIFYHEIFITWSTEFEKENLEFLIEASPNNKDWVVRGRIKSKGVDDSIHEYQFVDPKEESLKYYRLRRLSATSGMNSVLSQIELENYSISVDLEEVQVDNERKLVLQYAIDKDQELMVRIYNKIGEQVVTKLMPFKWAGNFIYHLDVSDLKPGNYLLEVTQVVLDKPVAERRFTLY